MPTEITSPVIAGHHPSAAHDFQLAQGMGSKISSIVIDVHISVAELVVRRPTVMIDIMDRDDLGRGSGPRYSRLPAKSACPLRQVRLFPDELRRIRGI